ncbi:MAG: amidohydrolase, partial [Bacteroidetes bacterium]|nr:amidohydrolase [Bacteroidota bacterium]
MKKIIVLFSLPLFLFSQHYVDIVFTNGKIWTVDPSKPEAEAVAVYRGRIMAVGSSAEIKRWIGKTTKVIDVKKKRLLPGFIDNHTHFMS